MFNCFIITILLLCTESVISRNKILLTYLLTYVLTTPVDLLLSSYKTKLALVQHELGISYKNLLDLEKQRMVSKFTLCNKGRRVENLQIPQNSNEFSYL